MSGKKGSLKAYRDKRDFRKTPEPNGSKAEGKPKYPRFVIHKHEASSPHYDVRLEVDGVLTSWAVPKGPSTDPSEKRLAIRTEDHPLEYADFEGTLPKDEYGGGTVLVWDAGTYGNLRTYDDGERLPMTTCLDQGQVEIWLEGKKLSGGYAFVRTDTSNGKERWLLIKIDDDEADARRKPTRTEPESVLSGRTLDEVAMDEKSEENP